MAAAQDKSELLTVTRKEWAKLQAVLDQVSEELALAKDEEDTSIKDIVGHRAHWIELFLGWYADGQAGRDVQMPAPGFKWNELKRYNSMLRAAQSGLSWRAARGKLEDSAAMLEAFIESLTDNELYGEPMKGGGNAWTTGRWAEAAGPSHYRSAAKYARARLRGAVETA